MNKVLIFRSQILPISETFIQAQVSALRSYRACFVGMEKTEKSLLVSEPFIASQSALFPWLVQKKLYYVAGLLPLLHRRELLNRLRAESPQLLHAHFAMDGVMAMPLAACLKIPLVVTLHGYDVTIRDSYYYSSLGGLSFLRRRSQLWEQSTLFICVSEFIRLKAIEIGYPPEKIRVHHIGIDCDRFTPDGKSRDANVVLFVGRLTEKKGCEYLIRAMTIVAENNKDAQLVIVGDGVLRSELESLAKALRVNCRFLGSQPSDVVREWLGTARVFCTPSVTAANGDSEGLPMVILEAQAMGVPVVGFRHSGIPEGVRDGETGLLADERDWKTLAQHIMRYLNDNEFWKLCSKAGPEWIRQQFNLTKQTQELEKIYDSVCQLAKFQSYL